MDSVFHAIKTRAYDPSQPQTLAPTAPSFVPQSAVTDNAIGTIPQAGPPSQPSLKRAYQEDAEMQDGQSQRWGRGRGDRPVKQTRRGGRGYDQRGGRGGSRPQYMNPPEFPALSGIPNIDPNDPLSSLLAMQQAMGFALPGMSELPLPGMMPQQPKRTGQRCRDYDTKGFCALGTSCPYEHGNDPVVVPAGEEYDPNNAAIISNGLSLIHI